MKTRTMILWIAIMVTLATAVVLILRNTFTSKSNAAPVTSSNGVFESRADEQGNVRVEVVPMNVELKIPPQFDVSLSTHSVELDDDLVRQSILVDDQSNEYKPVNWTGSGPGGHHRSGILVFTPFDTMPKYFELKIKDIGDIPERIFRWDVK